jgi:hypothetical protein
MRTWTFDAHSGGRPIPLSVRTATVARLQEHAARKYKGLYSRLEIRFRGALCYIDAYKEPREPDKELLRITHETREEYLERLRNYPIHLGRIRYFGDDRWSYAFYAYSNERYEPATFGGAWFGTPEEAFDIGAMYLHDE